MKRVRGGTHRRREKGTVIYTIGYEGRDGPTLMRILRKHGIKALADVRGNPISRKPDFRVKALQAFCEAAGIEYQPWASVGSTLSQRRALRDSGDLPKFIREFRTFARRTMGAELDRLAESVRRKSTVLMCYERLQEECHRSVVANLVANRINASVVAL